MASLEERIGRLEERTDRGLFKAIILSFFAGVGAVSLISAATRPRVQEAVRTRRLVVIDSAGVERIVLAAPLPDPRDGRRRQATAGMVINDPDGWERVGVGVDEGGGVGMGFDAAPGVGDPRNRERVNLIVRPDGHAEVRLLDNLTRVQARLRVSEDETAVLEFPQWEEGIMESIRIVSAVGDTIVDSGGG